MPTTNSWNTARDADHFRRVWTSHVNTLATLVLQAHPTLAAAGDEWAPMRAQLLDVIERATALEFPEVTP